MRSPLVEKLGLGSDEGRTAALVAAAVFAASLPNGSQSIAAIGGFALFAWWAAALVAVRGGHRHRTPRLALLAAGALGLYALWQLASIAWAGDGGRATIDSLRSFGYLGLLLAVIGGLGPERIRPALRGLALGTAAVVGLALAARLFPWLLDGDQVRLESFADAGGRLGYPVAYWNGLAFHSVVLMLLATWLGSTASTPNRRALALAAIPLAASVLYLTGSRGGLLSLIAGFACLAALAPVRSRLLGGAAIGFAAAVLPVALTATSEELVAGTGSAAAEGAGAAVAIAVVLAGAAAAIARRRLDASLARPWTPAALTGNRPAIALAALAVVVFFAVGGPDRIAEVDDTDAPADAGRGELTGRFLETGSRERTLLWETALDAFGSEPLTGVGAGNFAFFSNQNGEVGRPVRDAHSLYLESLAELGPLGLAAVAGLLGAGLAGMARRTFGDRDGRVAAAGAVLVAGTVALAIDWLWEIPAVMGLVIATVGILCGRGTARPMELRQARPPGRGVRLTAAAIGVAVALASLSYIGGERALRESREATAAAAFPEAAEAAAEAIDLMPLDSRPWIQLASVQRLAGDRQGAIQSATEATELSPEDPRPSALLALLYIETGDPRAEEETRRSLELAPGGG